MYEYTNIIDISPLVSEDIPVWPGDYPFRKTRHTCVSDGDSVTLHVVESTLHIGAHADAMSHFLPQGQDIAAADLSMYLGACQVVQVDTAPAVRVLPNAVRDPITAPRVLIRTDSHDSEKPYDQSFCSLSPELVNMLAEQGVVLIGIDTPSVDLFYDKELLSHHALASVGIAILEGLVLSHVVPGRYNLVALPLKLKGCDASPVRAVLTR